MSEPSVEKHSDNNRVFEDIVVVDLSEGMAGSLATMVMADNGATVVKVEPPPGDWARALPGFLMWNRGKDSWAIDPQDPKEQDRLRALIDQSDVVVVTKGGWAEAAGITASGLAAANPHLVCAEISGFGPCEELETLGTIEGVVAAKTGRMVDGYGVGGQFDRPVFLSSPVSSYGAAMLTIQGVTAALLARLETGRGRVLRTSLLEAASALVMSLPVVTGASGSPELPTVTGAHNIVGQRGVRLAFSTIECADGRFIQMCARQEQHFRNWLAAIGLEQLLEEPRFKGVPVSFESMADIEELEGLIRSQMKQRTQAEWMRVFTEDFDVGGDPFLTFDEFLHHPDMVANERIWEIVDDELGEVRQVGPLVHLSTTPARPSSSAPRLGARTLGDLGRSAPAGEGNLTASAPSSLPLQGVTIVELAYFLAAPVGTAMLAELGARVIKVEPLAGDPYRSAGPPSMHIMGGKESIAIDLRHEKGRAVMSRLLEGADAFIHGLRASAVDRLGFGPDAVRAAHPHLVYLFAGSYGSKGPQAHRAAFHSTPNALSGGGILQAGLGNVPVDDTYADPCSGLAVGAALAMGLLAQRRFGVGQYLETTMLTSTGYVHSNRLVDYEGRHPLPVVDKEQLGLHPLYRLYRCQDGWLFVGAYQPQHLQAMASLLEGGASVAGLLGEGATAESQRRLTEILSAYFAASSAESSEQTLSRAGIPAAAVPNDGFVAFALRHGLLEATQLDQRYPAWRLPRKIRFDEPPPDLRPPSLLGEHTGALLAEMGYSDHEIDEFRDADAVGFAEAIAQP